MKTAISNWPHSTAHVARTKLILFSSWIMKLWLAQQHILQEQNPPWYRAEYLSWAHKTRTRVTLNFSWKWPLSTRTKLTLKSRWKWRRLSTTLTHTTACTSRTKLTLISSWVSNIEANSSGLIQQEQNSPLTPDENEDGYQHLWPHSTLNSMYFKNKTHLDIQPSI